MGLRGGCFAWPADCFCLDLTMPPIIQKAAIITTMRMFIQLPESLLRRARTICAIMLYILFDSTPWA